MTLITKLEDSEEGLIGITKQGEEVHLGRPTVYTQLYDFGYKDHEKAIAVFSPNFIEDLQKKKRRETLEKTEKELEDRNDFYFYFNSDELFSRCENPMSNLSCALTCLMFKKEKEVAFRSKIPCSDNLRESYVEEGVCGPKWIKIHRKSDD